MLLKVTTTLTTDIKLTMATTVYIKTTHPNDDDIMKKFETPIDEVNAHYLVNCGVEAAIVSLYEYFEEKDYDMIRQFTFYVAAQSTPPVEVDEAQQEAHVFTYGLVDMGYPDGINKLRARLIKISPQVDREFALDLVAEGVDAAFKKLYPLLPLGVQKIIKDYYFQFDLEKENE